MKICMGCMEQYGDDFQVCPHCGYIEGTPAQESFHLEPGTILKKHYIVGKVIGSGGFGTTYLGWDYELGRKIAIKEYLPSEFATRVKGAEQITIFPGEKEEQFQAGIEKFIEEAQRLVRFKSVPGIVRFYDCFEENKTAYITMEYLEGETLKERLEREGKLSYEEARPILDALLDALEPVHKEGIIHRDIAPDNIFLTKDGKVKLIDFGASRFATTRHSRSLSVLIKEGYSPQEQYRSRGDQGPWTDVYSVAACFYTMVTGRQLQDAMERESKDEVKRPSKVGAEGLPKHVEIAVMNALNRKVEDRTQSCEAFKAELADENVRRNFIRQRKIDIGRWPLWLKVTSGIGTAVVAVFLMLLFTGVISFASILSTFSSKVGVPDVIGLEKSEAEETLDKAGFKVQYANYIEDENIPKDCIYNQNPGANVERKKGDIVYLSISCGVIEKQMIDAVGLEADQAVADLEELGISVQLTTEEGAGAPGTVLKQLYEGEEIAPGTTLKEGMVVTLVQSSGLPNIDPNADTSVPELVGKDFVAARDTAGSSMLYVKKAEQRYSDAPQGQVVEQLMAAGSGTKQGTIIELIVSKGDQIVVPLFQGKLKEEAEALAKKYQIKLAFKEQESDTVPAGYVISQSVEIGKTIKYTAELELVISKGNPDIDTDDKAIKELATKSTTRANKTEETKKDETSKNEKTTETTTKASTTIAKDEDVQIEVPDVKGLTEESAKEKLTKAGFNVTVRYVFSSTEEDKVASQSVIGGAKRAKGTKITIDVSKGQAAPSGWTTDGSFANSKWYTCEKKWQYLKQTRTSTEETTTASSSSLSGWTLYNQTYVINWGEEKSYSSQQASNELLRYVRTVPAVTHKEYLVKRWYIRYSNGAYDFFDHAVAGSMEDARRWHEDYMVPAATSHWTARHYKGRDMSDNEYPFIIAETYVVTDTPTQYVYQSGTKVWTYYFKRTVYGAWSAGEWVDSKPDTSATCQIGDTRLLYKYTEKK